MKTINALLTRMLGQYLLTKEDLDFIASSKRSKIALKKILGYSKMASLIAIYNDKRIMSMLKQHKIDMFLFYHFVELLNNSAHHFKFESTEESIDLKRSVEFINSLDKEYLIYVSENLKVFFHEKELELKFYSLLLGQ